MGLIQDFQNWLRISRGLPQPLSDTNQGQQRGSRYGEGYVQSLIQKSHILADEGSYFVTTNPTPLTGLATIAALTTLTDTSPFLLIKNNASQSTNLRAFFDFLRLRCTVPGTSSTSLNFAVKIGSNAQRYSSGGSLLVPVSPNMDNGGQSQLQVYAGALVANADPSSRLIDFVPLRSVIPVAGDIYQINFGSTEFNMQPVPPATIAYQQFGMPPIVIGPQEVAAFHLWAPAQTVAAQFEFTLGHWER